MGADTDLETRLYKNNEFHSESKTLENIFKNSQPTRYNGKIATPAFEFNSIQLKER